MTDRGRGIKTYYQYQAKQQWKNDIFQCAASSLKFTKQKDFDNFRDDLEDVMRRHKVYSVTACIFSEL